ncbi:RNA polymerase factor sigma-54 [Fodinicurvata sp. EGI_FJ10296]|uniref:RNA polymerase factor sigma-54 n=1 Tax=Fodinicurvata sp. EGI_FJ10296 TaxID=3231908 RepID=UPI00345431FA
MALTQRLDLRQSQQLVMTPQLQQAIKLLQLSNLELVEYIDQAVEQNPLLERGRAEDEGQSPDDRGMADYAPPEPEARSDDADRTGLDVLTSSEHLRPDNDGPLDVGSDDFNSDFGPGDGQQGNPGEATPEYKENWGNGGSRDFDGTHPEIDEFLAGEITLRDHLTGQINVDISEPLIRRVALHLLEYLDDAGYFGGSEDEIARELTVSVTIVGTALHRVQQLDPPGIFARTLRECLAIQLAGKDRLDPAMSALLDHLPLLAKRDYATLTRLCGVDMEDMSAMVAEIRALNPRPAARFGAAPVHTVTPDILMSRKADGSWLIELNPETLPRVLVNRPYYQEVSQSMTEKSDKEYLSECMASANWLVKSLHQRQTTILKVAGEIIRQQSPFFESGVRALKPLVLKDIADAIGMHESTVSRVTSNKFMATPRGVFELKYFFTSSIQGADGGVAHSAEAVRSRIKALVDAETSDTVLSDDRIVEILRADGVDIARRTIAKYREALRIPSSVQRRREKGIRP